MPLQATRQTTRFGKRVERICVCAPAEQLNITYTAPTPDYYLHDKSLPWAERPGLRQIREYHGYHIIEAWLAP